MCRGNADGIRSQVPSDHHFCRLEKNYAKEQKSRAAHACKRANNSVNYQKHSLARAPFVERSRGRSGRKKGVDYPRPWSCSALGLAGRFSLRHPSELIRLMRGAGAARPSSGLISPPPRAPENRGPSLYLLWLLANGSEIQARAAER